MKKIFEEINLTRGVYSVYELESINKIKPVSQFIKSNPVIEPKIIGRPNILNGKAWLKTHDTNIIDGEAWWKTHEPNSIDKPNIIDDEAWSKTHESNITYGEAWSKTHESNITDGEAWSKSHESNITDGEHC